MWATVMLVAIVASGETNISKNNSSMKEGGKVVASTTNFKVHSFQRGLDAAEVAKTCETLRSEAVAKWLGDSDVGEWQPCCTIVLHRSRASYANAVGHAASRTSGSSLIDFRDGEVSVRRIDLLAERKDIALSALPHELTHVVLADRFGEKPPPAWADEGMATLADGADKQMRHKRDLDAAIRRGQTIPLARLLPSEQYPAGAHWAAFYGQSMFLVGMLCERRDSDEFVRFVELGREQGYDRALREVYDIDGIAELERLWRDHAYP